MTNTPEKERSVDTRPSSLKQQIIPAWLVIGIFLLLCASVLSAIAYRPDGSNSGMLTSIERGELVAERQLFFKDHSNGDVSVIDAKDGSQLLLIGTGEAGFMRSVMRGLARERKSKGHNHEQPFRLTAWNSGLVSLIDPATGRVIELSAFGIDNVRAFSNLLELPA